MRREVGLADHEGVGGTVGDITKLGGRSVIGSLGIPRFFNVRLAGDDCPVRGNGTVKQIIQRVRRTGRAELVAHRGPILRGQLAGRHRHRGAHVGRNNFLLQCGVGPAVSIGIKRAATGFFRIPTLSDGVLFQKRQNLNPAGEIGISIVSLFAVAERVRELAERIVMIMHAQPNLLELIRAAHPAGSFAGLLDGGE